MAAKTPVGTLDASVPMLLPASAGCVGGGCIDASMRVPDDDGFTVAEGDCDDFSALVNPGAYDIPGNGIDEDCSGSDATTDTCDAMLAIDSNDAFAAAKAIDLCAMTEESSRRWGVISARWTSPDGKGKPSSPLLHGLLPNFGGSFAPRGGQSLLALSSGVARAPGQTGYTRDCSDAFPDNHSDFPAGFDGRSPSCPDNSQAKEVGDAVALDLRVRMPTNVSALSFDSAFFTEEYPDYICTPFNDYFQVIVTPMRSGGSKDGNVTFDVDGNPISVNNSLLRACEPGQHGGKTFACPLGTAPLKGTGYDDCDGDTLLPQGGLFGGLFGGGGQPTYGASTGWVSTEFAVQPAEIVTLLFTIWDSEDHLLDSLAIVDHARFRLRSAPPPPEKPMTMPILPD